MDELTYINTKSKEPTGSEDDSNLIKPLKQTLELTINVKQYYEISIYNTARHHVLLSVTIG